MNVLIFQAQSKNLEEQKKYDLQLTLKMFITPMPQFRTLQKPSQSHLLTYFISE